MLRNAIWLVVLLWLLIPWERSSPAQAFSVQQPSEKTDPTIKATVRQVLVPAVVTDKAGHPVSGLQQSDFSVFEDEVPQRIVAFSKRYDVSLEIGAAPTLNSPSTIREVTKAPGVGPDSPTRTYLICIDTLHSSFSNLVQARRALAKLFQKEHDGKAQYALMNLSRQIEVIQDSTRDSSLVLAALGSKKFQSSMVNGESSGIALDTESLRRMLRERYDPQACDVSAIRVQGTIPDGCTAIKREVEMFIAARAERTSLLTRTFIQELKNIISVMAGMPTERTLILISDGFNLVPGRELYGVASGYFPNIPEFRFSQRDTQPELNELLRLAQKSNVIVYGIDSRGVYSPASNGLGDAANEGYGDWHQTKVLGQMMRNESSVAWENGSAMAQLAAATGGVYFHNNNDVLAGLRRAFDDERERYVIAYRPSNDVMDGKYRNIRVIVRNKNLRVYAKTGYWASGN